MRTVLEIKNWVSYLPDERTVLKLLGYSLKEDEIDKFFTDAKIGNDWKLKKLHPFFHPLKSVYWRPKYGLFEELVDFLYENGYLKNKKVNSLNSSVINFLKAVSNAFGGDYKQIYSIWYATFVKILNDYFKLPEGFIVIEDMSTSDYLDFVANYNGEYDIFGDGKSCFINDYENMYVWKLIEENNGVVVTVLVFNSEKIYKEYDSDSAVSELYHIYSGGARFLLYESIITDKDGKEFKSWVAHNAYNKRIPFTPYFWELVLKNYFVKKFGKKPFMHGYSSVYDGAFWDLRKFLYVNSRTNGVDFVGFVLTYDEELKNYLDFHFTDNRGYKYLKVKEKCPVCGEYASVIYNISVYDPNYVPDDALIEYTIVGCPNCMVDSVCYYLETLHYNGLKDEEVYAFAREELGIYDYDDIYYPEEYEEVEEE